MSVVNAWAGAVHPAAVTVNAKIVGDLARLAVDTDPAFTAPVFSPLREPVSDVVQLTVADLAPATRHYWAVEVDGALDTVFTGQFLTHPTLGSQADFTLWAATCAGNLGGSVGDVLADRMSNHAVFDTLRTEALTNDWLFGWHGGDIHYLDLGSGNHGIPSGIEGASVENYRRGYDDVLLQPRQHQLYRNVPLVHVWDDHDFGPNDSDRTHVGRANAQQAYRDRVPSYSLPGGDGQIFHSFTVGRVLFIVADGRSDRDPNITPHSPSKTMLGSEQKIWMKQTLIATNAKFLVWLMPVATWHKGAAPSGSSSDDWGNFPDERDELADMFETMGWADRMVYVCGDAHHIGMDSGANNPYGGFPVYQWAPLDASASTPNTALWDIGSAGSEVGHYGTLRLNDTGNQIEITATAWEDGTELFSHQFAVNVSAPATTMSLAGIVSGSHRATFEARVLTAFQTGQDPSGTEIPILGGDVTYDATAQVFADLNLTTAGISEVTRKSLFPRRAGDLLAPYGNEVFIRRGVDIGSEILWVPLGYFRLNDTDQNLDSDSPIQLTGQDRMSGIIDGRLIMPRQFSAEETIGFVAMRLVNDIYPNAVILFDDDSNTQPLGRQLVVEENRYEVLHDMAKSLGKVVYWDGEGVLRIEDAPDPDIISWEIKAGRQGVLVTSGRQVSREGANAVVARGEGATLDAVIGIAVDMGVNSPTRWLPPDDPSQLWFGQVPTFYSSPLLTTGAGAQKAAASLLRRYIGAPYSVDWGSVVNPALRPREVVRITQKDGNREKHIVQNCTVPLTAEAHMTGTTREQTLLSIGQLDPRGGL